MGLYPQPPSNSPRAARLGCQRWEIKLRNHISLQTAKFYQQNPPPTPTARRRELAASSSWGGGTATLPVTWKWGENGHSPLRGASPHAHLPLHPPPAHRCCGIRGSRAPSGGPTMGLVRCPVRTLNMGRVESGRGTSRLRAMLLSSSVSPWMVVWCTSWMLPEGGKGVRGGILGVFLVRKAPE